jgi:hypothetical protein
MQAALVIVDWMVVSVTRLRGFSGSFTPVVDGAAWSRADEVRWLCSVLNESRAHPALTVEFAGGVLVVVAVSRIQADAYGTAFDRADAWHLHRRVL